MRQKRLFRILIITLCLVLISCQSLPENQKIEYVDYTSDISFPVFPEIKADKVAELTEAEYKAIINYMIEAEAVFDIITLREQNVKK